MNLGAADFGDISAESVNPTKQAIMFQQKEMSLGGSRNTGRCFNRKKGAWEAGRCFIRSSRNTGRCFDRKK
jgi:hypothetical protein